MNSKTITRGQLCKMFDHTNLMAFATEGDFNKLCNEAKDNDFGMVAINSFPVNYCKNLLKDTNVHVGAAIAFPLGQTTIESKVSETLNAINEGADEIDYVLNIAKVKEKNFDYIKEEMERIVKVCRDNRVIIKVIFEICYLTNEEVKIVSRIAKEVKPDFVKTSTGFGTGGATVEAVKLMKDTVGDGIQVKAAGGIRSWKTAEKMIDAGATRLGTSSAFKILEGFDNR
jgi:deoxyribose-phosphate aldolase